MTGSSLNVMARFAAFATILAFAVLPLALIVESDAALPAKSGEPLLAIFPPWWSNEHAFAAALQTDGKIVAVGGLGTALVMSGDAPDFADRLRASGAWLVIDAAAATGCSSRRRAPFQNSTVRS